MPCRQPSSRRTGAILVEGALVYPALFLFLFGLIVGGLGIVHYQQVACQAREATRYASVHGSDWAKATKQTSPTVAQIVSTVVTPLTAGMDTTLLTVQVQWIAGDTGVAVDWDLSSKATTTRTNQGTTVANRVRVTVTYSWFPELYLVGPISLQSVSEMPMSF